ncbi:alkaline ceramidase-like protein [Sporormia fimetaria CBS 119925]|uniref:Alkaline ceramidase-like protein n=1 Tax=Sporormia fimetaria CBS 119925 TaxID=1340428 RepID=A0A6A6VBD0_9PLEO|nr:alkaline ceramidase-like protein [Sporormia fimetaria CBS 119925]
MATRLLTRLLSLPYPPEQDGRWSPVTSTIDWCEENYYATIYSAEVVNTLTNLLFFHLAIKGIRNALKEGHDTVFLVGFVGYLLVGAGSFLFHATLKYPMQLVDELSMIYTTCLMCFATFSNGRSRGHAICVAGFLASLAVFVTGYYHFLQDPRFHEAVYAALTAVVVARSVYVMEVTLRPRHQRRQPGRKDSETENEAQTAVRESERDAQILAQMWAVVGCGLGLFLSGFVFWTIDNRYCSRLITWRRQVGLPWGILLEGHGWWHLMTGLGAYHYLVWGTWLRHCTNGRQDEYELVWPRWNSLPAVVRSETAAGADQQKKDV